MKVIAGVVLFLAVFAAFGQKKADVQILETKAIRDGDRITVDGRVKATNSLRSLVVYFDFRSPEKEVVTSQKAVISEEPMQPGSEGTFHSEMADAARAVRYTIRVFDLKERELRVANPGPYPIE